LHVSSPILVASLISSGHIASVLTLCLTDCDVVHVDFLANVPGLDRLHVTGCDMPEQWVLSALPALSDLALDGCSNLATLDAFSATSLTSLKLEALDSLMRVTPPATLKSLTCEGLSELTDVDLRAAPHVQTVIKRCPLVRLRMAYLALEM
jgi:hypothetical protein